MSATRGTWTKQRDKKTPSGLRFAGEIAALAGAPLPADVARAARYILLNAIAKAIGGSQQAVVDAVFELAAREGGERRVPVPGRRERVDRYFAAIATAAAGQALVCVEAKDGEVIQPGVAPLGAVLGLALERRVVGSRALGAFSLGCEIELRTASAMSSHHFDAGWGVAGTCGVIGAAVAAGLVIGLDGGRLAHAMGIASSQIVGHRQAVGTSSEPLYVGKAAANGVLSALLAERGFTGPAGLEAPRGFFVAFSADGMIDLDAYSEDLGKRWNLTDCAAMIENEVSAKARTLVELVLPGHTDQLAECVMTLERSPNLNALVSAVAPSCGASA